MAVDVQELMQTYNTLKAQRLPWEPTWQRIADTCLPAMNDILSYRQPGDRRTQHVFDSTGIQGLSLLSAHIAGSVTNFQMRWFEMRMAYEALNELKPVAVWLDAAAKTMQDRLAATATPQAFHEKYLQFAGFGTGTIFVDESPIPGLDGRRPLLTRSLPIATYCIAEDATGQVDSCYRELELSPRQAMQYFGKDALHPNVQNLLERAEGRHTPTPYVHAVYPRIDRDYTRDDQRNMPYVSCYVDLHNQHLVSEGGYRWFPYMASRWQKLKSWSPWGFGPGHIALPEMLTLNRMDMDVLRALQIHILPPFWTDDPDAVGRVALLPGYINPIAQGRQIQAMRGPGDFNISHLGMEERRQRIRQAFYMDQLLTLPPPDASGKMTAYEVAQRVSFMQRLMGPAFMRLLSEFLNPFIDVVFGLMLENDELPQPPDVVMLAAMQGYGKITVDYQGPLARAQRGDEVAAIEGTLAMAERIFAVQQDPNVIDDHFDIGELIRRSGKVYGIPASVLRDKTDTEKRQQARADAQAEAAQGEGLREDVKALGPASSMMKALMPAEQEAPV